MNHFSADAGSSGCEKCPYPFRGRFEGQYECTEFRVTDDTRKVFAVLLTIVSIYLICWANAQEKCLAVFVNLLMPTVDHITDIYYLIYEEFSNIYIFGLVMAFTVLAAFPLIEEVLRHPRYRPVLRFPFGLWWLRVGDHGEPVHHSVCYNKKDELEDVNRPLYICLWPVLVPVQLLTLVIDTLWTPFGVIGLVFWFLVGSFLYQSRSMAVCQVRSFWYIIWTGRDPFKNRNPSMKIDVGLLNKALLSSLILETTPLVFLQIVNNVLMDRPWSTLAYASTFSSTYMVFAGIYNFVYYGIAQNVTKLEDIPVPTIVPQGCFVYPWMSALFELPPMTQEVDYEDGFSAAAAAAGGGPGSPGSAGSPMRKRGTLDDPTGSPPGSPPGSPHSPPGVEKLHRDGKTATDTKAHKSDFAVDPAHLPKIMFALIISRRSCYAKRRVQHHEQVRQLNIFSEKDLIRELRRTDQREEDHVVEVLKRTMKWNPAVQLEASWVKLKDEWQKEIDAEALTTCDDNAETVLGAAPATPRSRLPSPKTPRSGGGGGGASPLGTLGLTPFNVIMTITVVCLLSDPACVSFADAAAVPSMAFDDGEGAALCDLMYATGIGSASEFFNSRDSSYARWSCDERGLPSTDPCAPERSWDGISCSEESGAVVGIDITRQLQTAGSGHGVGALPSSLAALVSLQSIEVQGLLSGKFASACIFPICFFRMLIWCPCV